MAALPSQGGSEGATNGDASAAQIAADDQPAAAVDAVSPPERRQRADYLKIAYGLVLSLGLTAGPLFPDLLTSGRVRVPKWLRKLRSIWKGFRRVESHPTKP